VNGYSGHGAPALVFLSLFTWTSLSQKNIVAANCCACQRQVYGGLCVLLFCVGLLLVLVLLADDTTR